MVVLATIAAGVGWAIAHLSASFPYAWSLELLVVTGLLSQRRLCRGVSATARAIAEDGLDSARRSLVAQGGREVADLDLHGVARGAIEEAAVTFVRGIVAPVFWYLLLGLPGLISTATVSALRRAAGGTPGSEFGAAARRLDTALNFVPARLAAVFFALAAAFVPSAHPWSATKTMARDANKAPSANDGWPVAALAGALGVSLGGPRRFGEGASSHAWIGTGRARASAHDVRRAIHVIVLACLIQLGLVAGLALAERTFG